MSCVAFISQYTYFLKMKKIILIFCIAFAIAKLQAQNVGINTTTPTRPLTVFANTFGMVQTNGVDTMGTWISPSGTPLPYAWVGTLTNVPLRMSSGRDNNHISIMNNGKVGIGNGVQSPSSPALLEIDGQIKINGGTPGTGKVLTTDATGLATWETPSGGSNNWTTTTSGDNIYSNNTGNVLIGTTSASFTSKLVVIAGIYPGIYGYSDGSAGVSGNSPNSYGVSGQSSNVIGVYGTSSSGIGVRGFSTAGIGVIGQSDNSTALFGQAFTGNGLYATNNSTTHATGKFENYNATGLALKTTTGNVELDGFTKLGNDATTPKIKMMKLTGTTTSADNTYRMMPHGLDASKILSISTLVTDGGYQYLPHSPDAGAIYTVNVDGANIAIGVKTAALSSSVMNKPFKILITYEE